MTKSFIKNKGMYKKINRLLKELLDNCKNPEKIESIKVKHTSISNNFNEEHDWGNIITRILGYVVVCKNSIKSSTGVLLKKELYFFEQKKHKDWTSEQRIFYFAMVCIFFKDNFIKEVFNLEKPIKKGLFTGKGGIIEETNKNELFFIVLKEAFQLRKQFLYFMLKNFPKDIKYEYLIQFQGQSLLNYFFKLENLGINERPDIQGATAAITAKKINELYDDKFLNEFKNNLFGYDYMHLIYPQSDTCKIYITKDKYNSLLNLIKKVLEGKTLIISDFGDHEVLQTYINNISKKLREQGESLSKYLKKKGDGIEAEANLIIQAFLPIYENAEGANDCDNNLRSVIFEMKEDFFKQGDLKIAVNKFLFENNNYGFVCFEDDQHLDNVNRLRIAYKSPTNLGAMVARLSREKVESIPRIKLAFEEVIIKFLKYVNELPENSPDLYTINYYINCPIALNDQITKENFTTIGTYIKDTLQHERPGNTTISGFINTFMSENSTSLLHVYTKEELKRHYQQTDIPEQQTTGDEAITAQATVSREEISENVQLNETANLIDEEIKLESETEDASTSLITRTDTTDSQVSEQTAGPSEEVLSAASGSMDELVPEETGAVLSC